MAEVSNRKFELLDCGADTCCGVVAQSQKKEQKLHPSVLLDALNVPPMAVDSDGTLHFGPRTVPLPALASPEARRSYTRQMWQRAQTSAARGGLASARILENTPPPAAGGSKETALKLYPVLEERIDAWNGTGPYAKDRKQRRNYRVIAVIRTTTYMLASAGRKSGITSLKQIQDRAQPTWIVGGNDLIFDYYAIKVEDLKAKGGGILPPEGSGPDRVSREKRASGDVFIGTGLLERLARVPGYERATVPLALFRGVDRPIPTVMRPNHLIYVRDDAPDDFAYAVAKALAEHRQLFQVQLEPWYLRPRHRRRQQGDSDASLSDEVLPGTRVESVAPLPRPLSCRAGPEAPGHRCCPLAAWRREKPR